MNIKIVDSWLREFLDTKASSSDIARELSLTSVSVERTEKIDSDHIYDIEVTTNRPDLMSVAGIAKEAGAVLPEQGTPARYIPLKLRGIPVADISFPIEVVCDPKLVDRICAVVMEVEIGKSPKIVSDRLEMSGIRSLNNVVDVTNYVMREVGHPTHVFDYDLLNTKKITIRQSKGGEVIKTLDGKEYRLFGGDIIAVDAAGNIIDLLGVMGLENSVVNDKTHRIMFFINTNDPEKIRKTSMSLGIRTEAAILNEKGVDPELAMTALKRGIELFEKNAKGKVASKILDIYPNKPKLTIVKVTFEKIDSVVGVSINPSKAAEILERLGFSVKRFSDHLEVRIPTNRADISIPEDLIEEIARVYGYHKLPSALPTFSSNKTVPYANTFYFEEKVKTALKYWGYTEVYTYSLIPESMFDGPIDSAIKIKNPLTEDLSYLRNSLIPGLLRVDDENKSRDKVMIFELSSVYHKNPKALPNENLMLGAVIKKRGASFFEAKGLIEALLEDLGIKNYKFKNRREGPGADVYLAEEKLGYIEILGNNLIDFELNFDKILNHASLKKNYKPLGKFPPITEDVTFVLDEGINTQQVLEEIQLQSFLITDVSLKDQFENSKTFHIVYQSQDKNLTNQEVSEIRQQIINKIIEKFKARVK